jgi:hypothetical protein
MFRPLLLGHHQARKEYKHELNCVIISIWIHITFLTNFLHNFRINSQAVKAKISIKN